MTIHHDPPAESTNAEPVDKGAYRLRGPGDDLRVDTLCRALLRRYYDHLLAGGMSPEEATSRASGAEYFVRDFVVDRKMMSLFDETPGTVRQFAGNWYIVNTLEPNVPELAGVLLGVQDFYRFLNRQGLISRSYLTAVESECDDLDYYRLRIESFWGITGDGYAAWERECSIKGN